jgi:hypothetical protein
VFEEFAYRWTSEVAGAHVWAMLPPAPDMPLLLSTNWQWGSAVCTSEGTIGHGAGGAGLPNDGEPVAEPSPDTKIESLV